MIIEKKIYKNVIRIFPVIFLYILVLTGFDLSFFFYGSNFSFNFVYLIIFFFVLKSPNNLGYGLIFFAGIINDVVIGFPIGTSSFTYLFICGFAAYLKNITLRSSILKEWLFFLFTILAVSSLSYSMLVLFFKLKISYLDIIINIIFTFFLYIIFASIFQFYQKLISVSEKND